MGRLILRSSSGADATSAFTSNFSTVENPLSEGGKWTNGLAVGGSWSNVRVTANGAVGASDTFYLADRFADDIAHVNLAFRVYSDDHYAQATCYRANGYAANGGAHEIELLLRFSITSGDAHGYEVLWGTNSSGQGYYAFVRWNGPSGSYTPLVDPGAGSIDPPADGDVAYAEIVGTTITFKVNGATIDTFDVSTGAGADNVWTSGQPGIGFWPVDGAIAVNLGWKNFAADDL